VDEKRSQHHANSKSKHGLLEFDKIEHVVLISEENTHLETSIERKNLEHYMKNALKMLGKQFDVSKLFKKCSTFANRKVKRLSEKATKPAFVALKNKNVNKNKDLQNIPCNNFQRQ
jgi:hypothetical protein